MLAAGRVICAHFPHPGSLNHTSRWRAVWLDHSRLVFHSNRQQMKSLHAAALPGQNPGGAAASPLFSLHTMYTCTHFTLHFCLHIDSSNPTFSAHHITFGMFPGALWIRLKTENWALEMKTFLSVLFLYLSFLFSFQRITVLQNYLMGPSNWNQLEIRETGWPKPLWGTQT